MIIDAKNLILGRLATVAAKKALLGEKIDVVNCEKAVVSGKSKQILQHYKWKISIGGTAQKGPYFPKKSEKFGKRTIRGMLPHKKYKGREVLKNIKCYYGIPKDFENKKLETIKEAHVGKIKNTKYLSVGHICNQLGGE